VGAWFSRTFLANVERRLWLAWIVATSLAALAIADTTPAWGIVVVLIVGVLPGWLAARGGDGAFGRKVQEHAHHVALRRARSPRLTTAGLLIVCLACAAITGPAAVHFLAGAVQDVMTFVVKLIYAAIVLAVGVGLLVALGAALTTKPTAGTPRGRMADSGISSFWHEFPPLRKR
jgi:hypothetical protein